MKIGQEVQMTSIYDVLCFFGRHMLENDAYCYILIPAMFLTVCFRQRVRH